MYPDDTLESWSDPLKSEVFVWLHLGCLQEYIEHALGQRLLEDLGHEDG